MTTGPPHMPHTTQEFPLLSAAWKNTARAGGRTLRIRVLSLISALAFSVMACLGGAGSASADTPSYWVSHIYMTMSGVGNSAQQGSYGQLVASLRNAAGHQWRNGIMIAQVPASHALIRMDLSTPSGAVVQLWFTPDNLYLRGFTTASGATYSFNDFDLRGAMQPASGFGNSGMLPAAAWGQGAYYVLPFGSDYNSLTNAANQGRQNMTISYQGMWNTLYQLAYADQDQASNQAIASDLMFMIQFTSESARFYDVFGVMNDIMGNGNQVYNGLPAAQQELENNWAQMTQYAISVSNGTYPAPLYVGPHVDQITNFTAVQARLALGIAPNIVSPTGDWNHAEL